MSRRAAACIVALTAVLAIAPRTASAQGIIDGLRVILDSSFSTVTTTTTQQTGTLEATTNLVSPRLILNVDTLIYPNLSLSAGGVFEYNSASVTFNGLDTTSSVTRFRPFFQLRSTNQVFSPGIGYFRRQSRDRSTGGPGLNLVSEDYAAYLGWKPSGLPQADFQFVKTNTFDDRRVIQDETKDYGALVSRYNVKGLGINYRGSYLGSHNKLVGLETRQWSNAARMD